MTIKERLMEHTLDTRRSMITRLEKLGTQEDLKRKLTKLDNTINTGADILPAVGVVLAAVGAAATFIKPYIVPEGMVATTSTLGKINERIMRPRRTPHFIIRGLQDVHYQSTPPRSIVYGEETDVANPEEVLIAGDPISVQAKGGAGYKMAVGLTVATPNPTDLMRVVGLRPKLQIEEEPEILQALGNVTHQAAQVLTRYFTPDDLADAQNIANLANGLQETIQTGMDTILLKNVPENARSWQHLVEETTPLPSEQYGKTQKKARGIEQPDGTFALESEPVITTIPKTSAKPRHQINAGVVVTSTQILKLEPDEDIQEGFNEAARIQTVIGAEKELQTQLGKEGYRVWKSADAALQASQNNGAVVVTMGGGNNGTDNNAATLGRLEQLSQQMRAQSGIEAKPQIAKTAQDTLAEARQTLSNARSRLRRYNK